MSTRSLPALTALALAACAFEMDQEQPDSRIGAVTGDCVVPLADRGAPRSLDYPDGSLWIFDDGTTAFVTDVAAACAGEVDEGPAILSLTAAEEADNASRTDGRQLAVRARGGFVDDGTGYLYYDLLLRGPGFWDEERLGTGLCVLSDRDGSCAREPAMLWPGRGRTYGDAAFVDADGMAYVYGCYHVAAFTDLCALARVDPAEAADPGAYRYHSWLDEWRETDRDVNTLFEAPSAISAAPNPWLGEYAAVVADIWESRLVLRPAATARGGFRDPLVLFAAESPEDFFYGGGREHPGLRAEGGRRIAISYHTSAGGSPALHLVSFRFDDPALP